LHAADHANAGFETAVHCLEKKKTSTDALVGAHQHWESEHKWKVLFLS
jgi:hypothetical protein